MDAVVLDGVVVRVSGRRILGPVSLRIERGERWVLLGPNGSGKTTMLAVAGAWRHPSSGRVEVLGETLGRTDVRDLRRRIGHVSHAVTEQLPFGLTVLEVVLTGTTSALTTWWAEIGPADRARAREHLDRVGCGSLADQVFGRCSQGERQRVLMARALLAKHELLILDEPAAGLDLPGREAFVEAMEAMTVPPDSSGGPSDRRGAGLTSVLATHHLDEVPPSTTHAALLRGGELVSAGPVDDVLTADALGRCFGIALTVERRGGRWSGFAAPRPR